jgi:hypothetical protein
MEEDAVPRAGDCVISKTETGTYDVFQVQTAGRLQPYRAALASLEAARDVARSGLDGGGRILVSHYSTPRRFARL